MDINDLKNVAFSKGMNGYKASEVDDFIDRVIAEFHQLKMENNRLTEKARNLEGTNGSSSSSSDLQGILESAQRFSEQLMSESREKAEKILTEATEKANDFESDFDVKRKAAEAEINEKLKGAAEKSEGIITAAHDSVARQQLLFDKLKLEVSEFKNQLLDTYKQQIEILSKFPIEVKFDAKRAAEATEFLVDQKPDFGSFVPKVETEKSVPVEEQAVEVHTDQQIREEPQLQAMGEELTEKAVEVAEKESASGFSVSLEEEFKQAEENELKFIIR